MFQLVYLKVSLVAILCWIILFTILKKKQRKEMCVAGVLGAIVGPIQELWYTKDYWHPEYFGSWPWIEDVLFGFTVVGIASVIYEAVFSLHIQETRGKEPHPFVFVSLVLVGSVGMGMFTPLVNSIYAAILSFLVVWLLIVFLRVDLLFSSLASAILMVILMFIGYKITLWNWPTIIQAWWDLEHISGVLLSGIPLEEYLWFFALGLAFGPLYEFWKGLAFQRVAR